MFTMDTEKVHKFHKADLNSNCFSAFAEMRENRELCDISIEVERKVFYAHRLVLSSVFPYFDAMFRSNMKECRMEEITMTDIDPVALEHLINFAYTSCLNIQRDNVFALLETSMFLQLDCVTQECIHFLRDEINLNNVFAVRTFAEKVSSVDLLEHADRHIREHFDEVSSFEEFLHLPFPALRQILCNDDLNAKSEENVFEFVMMWIKASEGDRALHLPDLLLQIRLTLVSPQYLVGRIATEELILKSHPCRQIVHEAQNYQLLGKESLKSCSFTTRERWCREEHHLKCERLMGFGMYSVQSNSPMSSEKLSVNYFDPVNMQWAPLCCHTQNSYCRNGVVCTDKIIYFIGFNSILTLKLQTLEWCSIQVTPEIPSAVGATLHRNKIYFFGGHQNRPGDSPIIVKQVRSFDPQVPELFTEGSIGTRRLVPSALSMKDDIYLLGGVNDQYQLLNSGEKYNTLTRQSTEISPMLTTRTGFRCAVLKEKIYACGGNYKLHRPAIKTCEAYDPGSNQWALIGNLNRKMSPKFLFSHADKLYIIDASSRKKQYLYFETYNPDEDKWEAGETLPFSEGCSTFNVAFNYYV